jgi:predicted flap endonuclease-1-like 5' DNA nuclease
MIMAKVIDVEGIGPKYAKKLSAAGIKTSDTLLKKGATPAGRKEISEKTGIGHELILDWVNYVDLYRIKGIGSEYSELLEKAGVDTVVELSKRKAEHLIKALMETNTQKKLVRKLPALSLVTDWIEQAKKLPRVIKY